MTLLLIALGIAGGSGLGYYAYKRISTRNKAVKLEIIVGNIQNKI